MNYRAWVAIILALCILSFFIIVPIMRLNMPPEIPMKDEVITMYESILMVLIGALSAWLGCNRD